MKTAIVPAQITTVEDKVAGNLSIQQLVLLVFPLFTGGGLYALASPVFGISAYKLVFFGCVTLVCLTAAIRIKGTLVVYWIARLFTYYRRPRLYVYKRSDFYLRERILPDSKRRLTQVVQAAEKQLEMSIMRPEVARTLKLQQLERMTSVYSIRKGGLHVSFVKEK